ncbi:MAG: hypothetical protein H6576_07445 [Lewinellaceae bacterium]|nr:hypothetical protein [Lewinellaceae bacterium]
MLKSNLYQLVKTFNNTEQRKARLFLESPYFNKRNDIIQLFGLLCQDDLSDKVELWKAIYPQKAFDDTEMRLLMSYLNRLLEVFLRIEYDQNRDSENKLKVAAIYRNRGLEGHYERNMRIFEREINNNPLRNARYHSLLREYYQERHETTIRQNPTDVDSLQLLAHHSDQAYIIHRLRLICLELAQKNVYSSADELQVHELILQLSQRNEWAGEAGIATYLAVIRMLQSPGDTAYYQAFKPLLTNGGQYFDEIEMRELYTFAINHCIRQTNSGEQNLEQEVLSLYQHALSAGYLFENGVLSRFTYHNIVAAALRCDELDWAEMFIVEYRDLLEESYRDSSFSFNKARVDYAQNRLDSVLELLQKANYRDPLLNLAAKTLLLKTYFVLGEFDLLQSHLDAMRNYIRRKKVIGYHRTNYQNIIRFTERILNREPHNKQLQHILQSEIENESVLTEKSWLLDILHS